MNRPNRIKRLFHEIRDSLGLEVSAREALRMAAHLVDVADDRDGLNGASFADARPIFNELPVDKALSDGGWRVLNKEREIVSAMFESEVICTRRKPRVQVVDWEMAA